MESAAKKPCLAASLAPAPTIVSDVPADADEVREGRECKGGACG